MKKSVIILVTLTLFIAALAPATLAQDGGAVTTAVELNVRSGPSTTHSIIGRIPSGSTIVPEGRNAASDWVLMHTPDNSLRGWVAAAYLLGLNISTLPLAAGEVETPVSAPATGDNQATTTVGLNMRSGPGMGYEKITTLPYGTSVTILQVSSGWSQVRTAAGATGWVASQYLRSGQAGDIVPPGTAATTSLTGGILSNARAIYARGRRLGNQANSFIKIGDSNTAGTAFFCTFHYGNYDLAEHTYLQDTITFFNQSGSFCGENVAARNGFSSFSVVDPLSADPSYCTPTESPLDCAIRMRRPSVAIIYLGLADMATLNKTEFRTYLNQIVRQLVNKGVIPILNTFPIADQLAFLYDPEFNTIVREVAINNRVPLIDLQQRTREYPNQGTGGDGYHLSYENYEFISFAAPVVATYVRNLRELLTLQMLDEIMHKVMGG